MYGPDRALARLSYVFTAAVSLPGGRGQRRFAFRRAGAVISQTKEVTIVPTAAKKVTIAELTESLGRSQGAIVTDYRGLTVAQITDLRRRLRKVGAKYQVAKNTLFRIALHNRELPDLGDILEGPSAVIFAEGDPVEATKVLMAFAKELRKDLPAVKGGLLGNRIMMPADVSELASLPPREQIYANLLGTMQTPVSNVVSLFGAVLQNLVGTIEAFQEKQAGSAA